MLTRRDLSKAIGATGAALLLGPAVAGTVAVPAEIDPLHLVDPELRAAAAAMLAQHFPPMTRASLPAVRASWVAPASLPPPAPAVETRTVPGARGDPPVVVQVIGVRAGGAPRPAILHIHGGGMISGRAQNMTAFCQTVAAKLDCVVVNVDYRLSPETPFPGPVEDNYAALVWVARNAAALGVDPVRIAVMGESAGGGLAAMVAIVARDRGEVRLCYQTLIYPMLDDRTGSTRATPPYIGSIGWSPEANRFGWTAFLGVPAGGDRVPTGAVPARVANLAGLPPAFIGVGAIDLFADEDMAYARRLVASGVPTQVQVTPGAFHAFDFVVPEARVSREFTAAWKSAMKAAFAVPV
ncbi:alpha/beta hydrolase [Glacieibacterium megasporae]|uniref:alpha/beta hydrolase n=1 Tax=Glacieibacterium megasporae TaxID=2835787 RepID=UPI001C1E7E92|nr:alpha/beta hydrolase [Polymorphobacter megasporae]UAJ11928.1 alpha/beta hydrolase [Polymorphobacter megasporae]